MTEPEPPRQNNRIAVAKLFKARAAELRKRTCGRIQGDCADLSRDDRDAR